MDELAQELVDRIIDDYYALANRTESAMQVCGLVCKRWLRRSRYHLFSRVTLSTESLQELVDLVQLSPIQILPFIRHLKLEYCGNPLDDTLLSMLYRCPGLTSIEIYISGGTVAAVEAWLDSQQTHLRSWSDNSASLSRLDINFSLSAMIKLPFPTIANIISCIPRMETLGVSNIYRLLEDTSAHPSSGLSRLAHMDLQIFQRGSVFFSWLLSLPVLPILKSLTFVGSVEAREMTAIEAYFKRAGAHLESLTMTEFSAPPDAMAFRRGITKYTTNLRNVTFIVESPSEILDTLQLLPASKQWNVIEARLVATFDDIPWSALDAALAEPRFRPLQRFLILSILDHVPAITSETKVLMPLANARRILG